MEVERILQSIMLERALHRQSSLQADPLCYLETCICPVRNRAGVNQSRFQSQSPLSAGSDLVQMANNQRTETETQAEPPTNGRGSTSRDGSMTMYATKLRKEPSMLLKVTSRHLLLLKPCCHGLMYSTSSQKKQKALQLLQRTEALRSSAVAGSVG